MHRLHYDVVSNGVLWFLLHGLFDTVRRPRVRPPLPRRLGRVRRGERGVRDAAADAAAPEGDIVLVQDYQLALVPAQLRELAARSAVVHFTHTPFCGPDDIRVAPDRRRRAALRDRWPAARPGSTRNRWAASYRQSDASGARPSAQPMHAPFAASLGPDVDALEEIAAEPRHA